MNRPDASFRPSGRTVTPHRGRRILALLAAIAVPAFAAPGDWSAFGGGDAASGLAANASPMPFETAGESFPGSAFYFLEDEPQLAYDFERAETALFDISGTGDLGAVEQLVAARAGPAARAFLGGGSGLDKARALHCMTQAIYYEAASEAIGGQRAVAQVVLNRVAHPSYPNSVCGVVFQGSERVTGCQFSFTCDGSLRRRPSAAAWARARMVAADALAGAVYAPVGLATHYHTIWIYPYWAPSLNPVGTIGAHRFYRWKGNAGQPGAFVSAYSGNEPVAAPAARKATAPPVDATDPADPLALARAFEEAKAKAEAEARRMGVPPRVAAPTYAASVEQRGGDRVFTAENLPDAGGVRPEYANSGRWLHEPGKPTSGN